MLTSFSTMIFDLNEGMHHVGWLPQDHHITGFKFIMSIVVTAIIMVAYNKIVIWSDWYEEHQTAIESIINRLIPVFLAATSLIILYIALSLKEYGAILIVTTSVVVTLTIAVRKEFTVLRAYLDEKFGWLF